MKLCGGISYLYLDQIYLKLNELSSMRKNFSKMQQNEILAEQGYECKLRYS